MGVIFFPVASDPPHPPASQRETLKGSLWEGGGLALSACIARRLVGFLWLGSSHGCLFTVLARFQERVVSMLCPDGSNLAFSIPYSALMTP